MTDAMKLPNGANVSTRALWESIFTEDDKAFLDYYDRYKMTENVCYGIYDGERLISMLQLNPYEMMWKGKVVKTAYIVAVATDPAYRHQGLMTRLLEKSISDAADEGMPFVFLMPAAEEIYLPFGFRFFYRSNTGRIRPGELAAGIPEGWSVMHADESMLEEIRAYSEKTLATYFDIYTKRDISYYKGLLAELACEGGSLLAIYAGEELRAVVPKWGVELPEVREVLCRPEDQEAVLSVLAALYDGPMKLAGLMKPIGDQTPMIMGRVASREAFLALNDLPDEGELTELFLKAVRGQRVYINEIV